MSSARYKAAALYIGDEKVADLDAGSFVIGVDKASGDDYSGLARGETTTKLELTTIVPIRGDWLREIERLLVVDAAFRRARGRYLEGLIQHGLIPAWMRVAPALWELEEASFGEPGLSRAGRIKLARLKRRFRLLVLKEDQLSRALMEFFVVRERFFRSSRSGRDRLARAESSPLDAWDGLAHTRGAGDLARSAGRAKGGAR